jgi:hypothetical protein
MTKKQRIYMIWLTLKNLHLWFLSEPDNAAFTKRKSALIKNIQAKGGAFQKRTNRQMFLDIYGYVFDIVEEEK